MARLAALLVVLTLGGCDAAPSGSTDPSDDVTLVRICRDPDYKLVQNEHTKRYVLVFNNGWEAHYWTLNPSADPKTVCP